MSTQVEEPAVLAADIDMVTTLNIGCGGLDRFLDLMGDRGDPPIKDRQGALPSRPPRTGMRAAPTGSTA